MSLNDMSAGESGASRLLRSARVAAPIELRRTGTLFSMATSLERYTFQITFDGVGFRLEFL